MTDFISSWRFSLLLLALVTNILLAPLLGKVSSQLAFSLLIIIMVFVLGNNRKVIFSYIALACAALLCSWAHLADSSYQNILVLTHLFTFSALTLVIALIIKNIFSNDAVTIDTISESLCAYLLLGFAFASVYGLIDTIQPGSFLSSLNGQIIPFSTEDAGLNRIYFSFITLLTVGYGDIVPNLPIAKLMTIIEGFFGQIYLVVLIARLVGMHVSQRNN
ncbi:MAG: potassium channel family protein [Gammaproteobacteria bacterium]